MCLLTTFGVSSSTAIHLFFSLVFSFTTCGSVNEFHPFSSVKFVYRGARYLSAIRSPYIASKLCHAGNWHDRVKSDSLIAIKSTEVINRL